MRQAPRDRPALTPIENFYQRVLAGDADEVQEQADLLLKERSLSSYYDEVALKGLQLAASDVVRVVLSRPQLQRIKETGQDLVADLDDYPDEDPVPVEASDSPVEPSTAERRLPKEPAPDEVLPEAHELPPDWRGTLPVLCIAGRGPLDEAASMMLAQLVRKHGLGVRVASHEAVSRRTVSRLEANGVAMVCISYLEISGNPSHLRYLLRRIRQRLPKVRVLVGLSPADDSIHRDEALRCLVGADDYVACLREAVNACLKATQTDSNGSPASHSSG